MNDLRLSHATEALASVRGGTDERLFFCPSCGGVRWAFYAPACSGTQTDGHDAVRMRRANATDCRNTPGLVIS